ncbi:MAG: putative permease, partial [Proteobacteria bacterium]|nr:putative permease [Pseudomonadota bacterium]
LSLQSILMVAAVIGRPKTFTYVALVALFSIVAGLAYGAWVDGADRAWIVGGLGAFVAVLMAALSWLLWRRAIPAQV